MAVSIIDGTIEAMVLKRVRQNVRVYERISFVRDDGRPTTIAKAVVQADVAELLEPGTKGRFYVFNAIDHRGLHGVRTSEGRSVFAFSKMNERAMLVTIAVGLVLGFLYVAVLDRISLWPILLLVLGVPGYFLYRRTRIEAESQFRADNPGAAV
jgi:hypothetical protein